MDGKDLHWLYPDLFYHCGAMNTWPGNIAVRALAVSFFSINPFPLYFLYCIMSTVYSIKVHAHDYKILGYYSQYVGQKIIKLLQGKFQFIWSRLHLILHSFLPIYFADGSVVLQLITPC